MTEPAGPRGSDGATPDRDRASPHGPADPADHPAPDVPADDAGLAGAGHDAPGTLAPPATAEEFPAPPAGPPGPPRSPLTLAEVGAGAEGEDDESDADEEMPRVRITRRHMLVTGLFVVSAVAFFYFVLPQIAGLQDTWERINDGDGWWLICAGLLELLSFASYVVLFRTVFVRPDTRIDWRASYQITMAGVVATRLFAAAGAGGVALTAWALRRSGMRRRVVATRMIAFITLLYAVYMFSLVIFGLGLDSGILAGPAPFGLTVLPALLGGAAITVFGLIALVPSDVERRLAVWAKGGRRMKLALWARRLATVPASTSAGVRTALAIVRDRDPGGLGAIGWWAFDMATLWACFHAFGDPPPIGVLVMGYFVGMLANLLPIPGGIGGVEGGMIGAFIAFGVPSGLAVVAVLTYRAFSFWLPMIPGAIAYLQLRKTVARWAEERHAAEDPAAEALPAESPASEPRRNVGRGAATSS